MSEYLLSNVHNDINGYKQLLKLYAEHKEDLFETIDLTLHQWFDANLCAVLGGIIDKIESNLNSIKFIAISESIQKILQKNGFLCFYGYDRSIDTFSTTIEYKKLKPEDTRYFNKYLEEDLLNKSVFPNMTNAVHERIGESIQEMFINAQMHSETEYIYTCGQYFYQQHKINFTIVDTGIGFAKRIEKDLEETIASTDAIKWAMIDGNTTKQGVSGGLGLALLKEFITKNKGKIQIISGDAFYELNEYSEKIEELDYYFDGSVISMTFMTNDTKTYRFVDENIDLDDIF